MQITVNMNRFVFSLYIVCLVHAQVPQNCVRSMAVNDVDTGGSHLAKIFDSTEVEQKQRQQLEQQQQHQQQLQQQHHHHMRHGHTRVHHHNHHHPHHHRTQQQQQQPQQQLQLQQQQHHTHHHHNMNNYQQADADHFVDAGNHNDVMDHESGHTQPNMVNFCHKQNNRSEIAVT